jgi:hypothetical protein
MHGRVSTVNIVSLLNLKVDVPEQLAAVVAMQQACRAVKCVCGRRTHLLSKPRRNKHKYRH